MVPCDDLCASAEKSLACNSLRSQSTRIKDKVLVDSFSILKFLLLLYQHVKLLLSTAAFGGGV